MTERIHYQKGMHDNLEDTKEKELRGVSESFTPIRPAALDSSVDGVGYEKIQHSRKTLLAPL